MKAKSKTSGYIIRSVTIAVLFLSAIVGFTSAFNLPSRWSALPKVVEPATQTKTLTFADRLAYQRAIEEVYWRHRIWPKENQHAEPSLDKVMTQAAIENKVKDYLRNSQLLEQYWQKPITPEQLQAQMDRMAHHTKQPEVLREIFAALGNDQNNCAAPNQLVAADSPATRNGTVLAPPFSIGAKDINAPRRLPTADQKPGQLLRIGVGWRGVLL